MVGQKMLRETRIEFHSQQRRYKALLPGNWRGIYEEKTTQPGQGRVEDGEHVRRRAGEGKE